ncbi:MAG: hypothetical protein KDE53_30945 [Caldilineaceae bacterium]|nr:hypothetical protein [Caldilineaceae bacterium]
MAANSMGLLAGGTVTALAATFRWLHLLGVNGQAAALAGVLPLLFNNGLLLFVSFFGLLYLYNYCRPSSASRSPRAPD